MTNANGWGNLAAPLWVGFPLAAFIGSLLATPDALGAVHYQALRSFGNAELMGAGPVGPLVEGRDGVLYGTSGGGTNGAGIIFKFNRDGSGYKVLHHFGTAGDDGQNPQAGLLEGSDGAWYGTTSRGGSNNAGTVLRLSTSGDYTVLYSFSTNGIDGQHPAGLVEGDDGALYGITGAGGTNSGSSFAGALFKLSKDGSGYSVLHSFGGASDGGAPSGRLLEGNDGLLYGTTRRGGNNNSGTVFKLDKTGGAYAILHHFSYSEGSPETSLVQGINGALYGTTTYGGASLFGTVFQLNTDGSVYSELHSFGGNDPNPSGLMKASDGALYGATRGGECGYGRLFRLGLDGSGFSGLYSFRCFDDGRFLSAALVEGSDGALYGTSPTGGRSFAGTAFKLKKDGSDYALLRHFSASGGDGQYPQGSLMEASDSVLYGTTQNGGSNNFGTVFKINKEGSGYTVLHHFAGHYPARDGQDPNGRLIEGSEGALYGTTRYGGSDGDGTVFKLNKDGSGYGIVHDFNDLRGDGWSPLPGLVQGSDGVLYGTTQSGGIERAGTVFRLNSDGSQFRVLHSFTDHGDDGRYPDAGLLEGSDGALYGTTSGLSTNFNATVFKLNKDGSEYSVLRRFSGYFGGRDGANPQAALIQGNDGALYGTTTSGGSNNVGTVFRLNKDGSGYVKLHDFSSDGHTPYAELVEGADGALYGTTQHGGPSNSLGTVFRLSKDGSSYSGLYYFSGPDGQSPRAGLVLGSDGSFYGTTHDGGNAGRDTMGVVFRLLPPQTPDLIRLTKLSDQTQLTFAGVSGSRYQVLRSTELNFWNVLGTITMPTAGIYTNVDHTPPNPAAFYRAAWVP